MRGFRSSTKGLLGLVGSFVLLGGCTPSRTGDASPMRTSAASAVVAALTPAPAKPAAAPLPRLSLRTYTKPAESELASRLTPIQFEVTQHAATEPSFQNAYWNNHEDGIYVDVATGEPLFSSHDKFESGTGWPSFTRPIEDGRVVEHTDSTYGMARTEVVSAGGASHLGHVFNDGPAPTGMRFCINSASLRFIPADRLVAEGYGAYAPKAGGVAAAEAPAPATSNSCTLPPPGEKAGCSATLDVAIFARGQADEDAPRAKLAGVLEIVSGHEGAKPAVEVTFDPSKLSYAQLVKAWTKGREKGAVVYAQTDEEKQVASAGALQVMDAVPFTRN